MRLLFGTDYPPNFVNDGKGMQTYIQKIKKLDLDKKTIEAMLSTNAIELIGINV
jgi:predicted TIM-barrel fold metal-dependent hydrolase